MIARGFWGRSCGALVLVATLGSAAMGEPELEDALDGFESGDPALEADVEPPDGGRPHDWIDLSGSFELSGSVNYLSHRSATGTDYDGLSRLRNRLNLEVEVDLSHAWLRLRGLDPQAIAVPSQAGAKGWRLLLSGWGFWDAAYLLGGRDDFTRQVLDEYELDAEVGEAFVEGSLSPRLDVKLGRQIVVWGGSETLRVLDVLNPIDYREPGRVDLEDLRRPLTIARFNAFLGDWTFSLIAIPEVRFNRNPVLGSDFFPSDTELPQSEPANFALDSTEWAAAAVGVFRGWELAFHVARFWNDAPRIDHSGSRLVHDRLLLLGVGTKLALGNWLLRSELAWTQGLGFGAATREANRLDLLLGLEYRGWHDTTLVLEAVDRHLFPYESAILSLPDGAREDSVEIAVRLTRTFYHDRLRVTGLGIVYGWDGRDGAILRVDADYEVRDALTVGIGLLLYQKGDRFPLAGWGRNDRVLFRVRWSF